MSDSKSQILNEIKKLGHQIKKLDQRVAQLDQRVGKLENNYQTLEKKVEGSEERLNNNLIKFKDEILGKIENLQTDVTLLTGDKDQLEDHEERITKLESKATPA